MIMTIRKFITSALLAAALTGCAQLQTNDGRKEAAKTTAKAAWWLFWEMALPDEEETEEE